MLEVFHNPKLIEIHKSRWDLMINIKDKKGNDHKLFASADSGLTWGDGLWFGDEEEYKRAQENLFQ